MRGMYCRQIWDYKEKKRKTGRRRRKVGKRSTEAGKRRRGPEKLKSGNVKGRERKSSRKEG